MSRSSDRKPVLAVEGVNSGELHDVSFAVAAGETVKVVLPTEDRVTELYRLLTSGKPPARGRVEMFGTDVRACDDDERLGLCRRLGVVPRDGGLISNLKAWENMVLPSWYHGGFDVAAIETSALALLAAIGVDERAAANLMPSLPDALTSTQCRAIAFVRAMLSEPEVMLYEDLLSGMDRATANRWLPVAADFHRRRAGRASLYLCSDDAVSERIEADRTVKFGC